MNKDVFVIIEHLRGRVADISYVMLAAARVLAQETGGNVVGVLLGHNAQGLADTLKADRVLYLDHPALADFASDPYQKVLAHLIGEKEPRAVLLGNTSIGSDVAITLSARLGLPLVSSCLSFGAGGAFTSQICGGKIMAEGDLLGSTTLVTMLPGGYKSEEGQVAQPPEIVLLDAPTLDGLRVSLTGYIEPEAGEVDISQEPILIAVGRGVQTEDNIELADELAELMGGVCVRLASHR